MNQKDKFTNIIKKHEAILMKNNVLFNVIGYIKLLIILLFSISIYLFFAKGLSVTILLAGLILLIALWIYHGKLHKKINYSCCIIEINKKHLDRISGKWVSFADFGGEFINQQHPYSGDLDIVGEKSFFQYLNTTNTWYGRQAFANDLLHPRFTEEELYRRQKAIDELSKDINFSNHMQYCFSKIGTDNSVLKLVGQLKGNSTFIKNKLLKLLIMYVPLAIFMFTIAIVVFGQSNLYIAAAFAITLQAVIWLIGIYKTQRYLSAISTLSYKLNAYSEVINILKNRNFKSDKLKHIQTQLGSSELSAEHAIKSLSKISDKVSVQSNVIIWFIINALLLWDYACAITFENWRLKYSSVAEGWFLALGEFESLLSFSNMPNICDNTCLPSVADAKVIKAQELGHPLITNGIRVNNNIDCQDNIFIISGSNMSGKTTYLRTVGINFVLARAGSFICAKQMFFSPMEVMTSMRIADDLNEGISTFYAELKRIKSIIEFTRTNSNSVFLIDEIFRGTNSIDRLSGAKIVLSKLNEVKAIGIITTHDLELCEMAKQYPRIKNYNFAEYYQDNEIHFDYKMKQGKSTTTNAKYLMEMIGIT